MPVRRITNGGRKVIGKFPSIKNDKMVWWESQLERDYLYLLEIDPDVLGYEEQPLKVRYSLNGEIRKYTPDLRVVRHNRRQIVEIKDEKTANEEEYVELFRRVAPICQQKGYEFVVVTERAIRNQPMLKNIKLIYKYAKTVVSSEHQIYIHVLFERKEILTLEEVIQGLALRGIKENVAYACIYNGILSVDLSQPINAKSAVHLTLPSSAYRRKTA